MSSSIELKAIVREARPYIEQQLDLAEIVAGLREKATAIGLDWSQIKALLKAQIQDERDDNDGKRVKALVAKAEHASAYADMLGMVKMNEKNFSAGGGPDIAFINSIVVGDVSPTTAQGRGAGEGLAGTPTNYDAETGELLDDQESGDGIDRNEAEPAVLDTQLAESSPGKISAPITNSEAAPSPAASEQPEADTPSAPASGALSNPAHDLPSSQGEPATGAGAPEAAAPLSSEQFEPPAFLSSEKAGCLKLRDGQCRLRFATTALCAECNQERMRARVTA